MKRESKYVSKKPQADGHIEYTDVENSTWAKLYDSQIKSVSKFSCPEFIDGMTALDLPTDKIPQIQELSYRLKFISGWRPYPVDALISMDEFFKLLAGRNFPVATFIRSDSDFNYIEEPDIFHEVFGHCTMLTNQKFANFIQAYGELGVQANKEERKWLSRLFWFTVEFGLIQTEDGLKTYGAGLNSSPGECEFSILSDKPLRKKFKIEDIILNDYKIDEYQKTYYIIDDFQQLVDTFNSNLLYDIRNMPR